MTRFCNNCDVKINVDARDVLDDASILLKLNNIYVYRVAFIKNMFNMMTVVGIVIRKSGK